MLLFRSHALNYKKKAGVELLTTIILLKFKTRDSTADTVTFNRKQSFTFW